MEIHLTDEQEVQLTQLVVDRGCEDLDSLVQEILSRYLEEESRFMAAIKLGEAELDRGEYLTHEDVAKRIQQWFQS